MQDQEIMDFIGVWFILTAIVISVMAIAYRVTVLRRNSLLNEVKGFIYQVLKQGDRAIMPDGTIVITGEMPMYAGKYTKRFVEALTLYVDSLNTHKSYTRSRVKRYFVSVYHQVVNQIIPNDYDRDEFQCSTINRHNDPSEATVVKLTITIPLPSVTPHKFRLDY